MGLLRAAGYTNVRAYVGGMADWTANGLPVESGEAAPRAAPEGAPAARGRAAPTARRALRDELARPGRPVLAAFDALAARPVGEVLAAWVVMVLGCGLVYWAAAAASQGSLLAGGEPVAPTLEGLLTSVYFSFVTALSLGYGDVVPAGWIRLLAVTEATSALLVFGFVIAKFLSRRQDALIEEIHKIAFEDRLDRIRTNLHLVLSELQAIAAACAAGSAPPGRILARAESAALVFTGELRTIHDILYRPQEVPEEEVLQGILASLASALEELGGLTGCLPEGRAPAPALEGHVRSIARLAGEICSDCVPRAYEPRLRGWMDRVQAIARGLGAEAETRP